MKLPKGFTLLKTGDIIEKGYLVQDRVSLSWRKNSGGMVGTRWHPSFAKVANPVENKGWSASAIDIFHEIMGYECDDEMAQGIISDFIEKHVTEDTFRAWMVTARKQTLDSLG